MINCTIKSHVWIPAQSWEQSGHVRFEINFIFIVDLVYLHRKSSSSFTRTHTQIRHNKNSWHYQSQLNHKVQNNKINYGLVKIFFYHIFTYKVVCGSGETGKKQKSVTTKYIPYNKNCWKDVLQYGCIIFGLFNCIYSSCQQLFLQRVNYRAAYLHL